MKRKIIVAIVLFFLSFIQIADWIIFAYKGENENLNIADLNAKYTERFPSILQLYFGNTGISTLVCTLLFITAGLIFITEKGKKYFVAGILSFLMAAWQLFSLM